MFEISIKDIIDIFLVALMLFYIYRLMKESRSLNVFIGIIVFERAISLVDIVDTGDILDARINQRLIENIFFKNSPLHDGAMVIVNKRIRAAGCILPVSHNHDIPKELGLRHRAALGISQDSDCIAIVVSEETGGISVAIKGTFQLRLSAEKLENILSKEMSL